MDKGRKEGIVFHGKIDTGFYLRFSSVIARYPGHLLANALEQITCPTDGMHVINQSLKVVPSSNALPP
jgi:hypothetical protein